MFGNQTVSAYCWSFFPFRVKVLNEWGYRPRYYQTEESNQPNQKVNKPNNRQMKMSKGKSNAINNSFNQDAEMAKI